MLRFGRVVLLVGLLVSFCRADRIYFNNGDILTGTLVRMQDGKVVFNAQHAGELTLDVAAIRNFTSEQAVDVHLADGGVINTTIDAVDDRVVLAAEGQALALDGLTAINPVTPPRVTWSGKVGAGLTSTHGNSFGEDYYADFEAIRRCERNRTRFFGDYDVSRAEVEENGRTRQYTKEEAWKVGVRNDFFLDEKLYLFVNGTYKKDHIADLDRRITSGVGVGYQWFDSDAFRFSTDVGAAHIHERYTTRDPVTWIKHTSHSDEPSLQLGYALEFPFATRFRFLHNLQYYPSFNGLSDYLLTANAELRTEITNSLFAGVKATLEYDAQPADDSVGSTDTKYMVTLGYKF